jgi:ribosomal protein S18 acetylase RimI-like enzyme
MRRRGIGRLVLRALLDCARVNSFSSVILETTSTWQDAINFYLSQGFCVTHVAGGDTYFRLELD